MTVDARRMGLYILLMLAAVFLLGLAGVIPVPHAQRGDDPTFWALFAGAGLLPGAIAYLTRDPRAHYQLWTGMAMGAGALWPSYAYCADEYSVAAQYFNLGALSILAGLVAGALLSWRRPEWRWRVVGILTAVVTGLLLAGGWVLSGFCHFSLF